MKIVFGLGNPGARYRWTRHNVGFRVVELLAERHGGCFEADGASAEAAWTCEVDLDRTPVVLAKPRTFMNRVGRAGRKLCEHYKVEPHHLIVVHDDADLSLGRVRIRPAGRAGGHNGIRSLIACLETEAFPRVRLGIRGLGRGLTDLTDYVLENFDQDERPVIERLIELGADAVESAIEKDLPTAMSLFNRCSAIREGSTD